MSRRTFTAAAVLSAFAGFVDGFGFVYLGGYFVSFMSGNTTRASVDLAGASLVAAGTALLLIAAFVVGAMIGTSLPGGRMRGETRVLILVLVGMTAAAATSIPGWTWVTGALLAAAMGALNTVFARGGEVTFGITYMTGALVKFATALVAALKGGPPWAWARHLVLWLAIALGAVAGAGAFSLAGATALWLPVIALAVALAIPQTRAWLHV
ncbi:YoaK family protein [Microbacterium sp. NPDC055910]|uniref:YoaK family protein n=1 Tax=Microbacterium sp. NPDC055910 TaxID=3345659 RepID=UPI0035E27A9D